VPRLSARETDQSSDFVLLKGLLSGVGGKTLFQPVYIQGDPIVFHFATGIILPTTSAILRASNAAAATENGELLESICIT
jgi:hypothetical protein